MSGTKERGWRGGLAVVLALSIVAGTVRADDAPPAAKPAPPLAARSVYEFARNVSELEAAASESAAGNDYRVIRGIQTSVALAAQVPDAALRARLVMAVGTLLERRTRWGIEKAGGVEKAAIQALGDLADPNSFRFLRPFLVQAKPDADPPLLMDAIGAASRMKADEAVPMLLTILQQSKVIPLAVAALKAFSTFGQNRSTREKILLGVVESLKKYRPAVSRRGFSPAPPETDASIRYGALAEVTSDTLNQLTGQNIVAAEDWIDVVDKHKGGLKDVFPK